jgi:outer membrane protein assembly factor BamB
MSIPRFALPGMLLILGICTVVRAENWGQWRGPQLNGISTEKNLPAEFGPDKNVAWRTSLPGPAGSTPVVWDDNIFLTSVNDDGELLLMCLGTDGKVRWSRAIAQGNRDVRGDEGNSASPSPCTDGKHVWAMFANGILVCYDLTGNEVWRLDLQERYGKFKIAFGMTATPVLDGDRLYLQLIHGEGDPQTREAVVACIDKNTAKEIWKADRPSDAIKECEHSYASPTIYRDSEREYLLTHGADYIVAHDLKDGRELWRSGGLNLPSRYNPTLRFVASPTVSEGLIVVPSAKSGPVLALKPTGKGDITDVESYLVWKRDRDTPDVPSPLIVDGLVYLCRESGNLICMDAKTGEEYYNNRTHVQRHRASPVYADGKIFLTARDGTISVVAAGKEFKMLSQNNLSGESISSSPAIADGRIYFRTFDALWAIEQK